MANNATSGPSTTPSPAETLRRAAALMREENPAVGTDEMVPATLRAVADLLDGEANAMERSERFALKHAAERTATYNAVRRGHLTAVARAYLGDA